MGMKLRKLSAELDKYERAAEGSGIETWSSGYLKGMLLDGGVARELVDEIRDQHQQILDAENKCEMLYDGIFDIVTRYCDDPGPMSGEGLLHMLRQFVRDQDREATRASEDARETYCKLKDFEARVEAELHGLIAWFLRVGAPNLVAATIETARERLLGTQRRLVASNEEGASK